LHAGLFSVVQSALVGSVLANSVLVLGIAFTVGGIKNGTQRFDSDRARMISTLALVAAATMAIPSLAHQFHTPAAPHGEALSLICAGVLLVLFLLTLPSFIRSTGDETHEPARWSPAVTAIVLGVAGLAAAFTADWFISALTPALHTLHMSQDFAGLVIVAIAGNAVENVVGVQFAARNRPDFAISVIMNSSLQVSLALTPLLVIVSLLFATHLTLVFPTLLALTLVIASILGAFVVNDGRSTWQEGAVLVGFYVVIASSFWWGT
jgi:Ca2+:H+ antiporter